LLLALDPCQENHHERAHAILATLLRLGEQFDDGSGTNPYAPVHEQLDKHWQDAANEVGKSALVVPEPIARWSSLFARYLAPTKFSFPTADWMPIRASWIKALRSDNVEELPVEGARLRFALNAAWKARLGEPARAQEIAESCTRLCRRIMSYSIPSPPPAMPSQGSAPNLAR
jgi:hypothetical protein